MSLSSFGSTKSFVKCLGAEESYIHSQKIGGAYKFLNQTLIGEIVLLGDSVEMKAEVLEKVCQKGVLFPSFIILKEIMAYKKDIFYSTSKGNNEVKYQNDLKTIGYFQDQIFQLFLDFLSQMQAETNDAKCLQKMFPELKSFYFTTQHTQEDQSIKNLFKENPINDVVFDKLSDLNWKKSCSK